MKIFFQTITSEILFFIHNKKYLILFLLPILYFLLITGIYSQKVIIKVPVISCDLSNSNTSRLLLRYLNLTRSINIKYSTTDYSDIKKYILARKVYAGLYIPKDFEQKLKKGQQADLLLFLDGTNILIANNISADAKQVITTISTGIKIKLLRKSGNIKNKANDLSMQITSDSRKLYNPYYNYLNYLIPGITLAVLQQFFMLFGVIASLQFINFKKINNLSEALIIYASKMFFYLAYSTIIFFTITLILFPLFGINITGNMLLNYLYFELFVTMVFLIGGFCATLMKDGVDAVKAILLISSPAFILSGYTWPISSMPFFIKPIAYLIPLTVFLEGFRNYAIKGLGFYYIRSSFIYVLIGSIILIFLFYLTAIHKFAKRKIC